jgi:3-oxoacyl-[acyl-carrier-protein] synthase-3
MGAEAVRGLLEKSGTLPKEIDLLICATTTPDFVFPSSANLISDMVGIRNVGSFDVQAACSGFVYALTIAAQFIQNGTARKVVVVGADKMSSIIDYTDRATCVLFGDGAGAVLVEPSKNGHGIRDALIRADGAGMPHLHQKAGGSRMPPTAETVAKRLHYVHQEGAAVYKFAVARMAEISLELMLRNKLNPDKVDWLVPHQANKRIIEAQPERAWRLPKRRFSPKIGFANSATGAKALTIELGAWGFVSRIAFAGRAKARKPVRVFAMSLVLAFAVTSKARGETDGPLMWALALAEAPPALDITLYERPTVEAPGPGDPVNLLIAAHKTSHERYSDTYLTSGKKRRRPVETSMRLRRQDDANFTNRTRFLARRIEEIRSAAAPQLARATTGEELLAALIEASRRGPIGNLVVYGHAASNALFMREDRGFYASVRDVARETRIVEGVEDDRLYQLRDLGARDLADFARLVERGDIRFTDNAVIVFAGCGVAGKREVETLSIAARATDLTGATVIASIDVTDQSMGRGRSFRNHEYSRRTWVRFVAHQTPERLNTRVIDALRFLNLTVPQPETPAVASAPQTDEPRVAESN